MWWVNCKGDSPSFTLLQMKNQHRFKMPKYFLSLCLMDLKDVREKVVAQHTENEINRPNREKSSRRWKGSKRQVVPVNSSKKVWPTKVICFLSANRYKVQDLLHNSRITSGGCLLVQSRHKLGRSLDGGKPVVNDEPGDEISPHPL